MRTWITIALAAGGLCAWIYGVDHFFDSFPDHPHFYHRTGTAALIEDAWLSLYTPTAVAAALSAGARTPFFAGHTLAFFGFAILQVLPLLLLVSRRVRNHFGYRRVLDQYCLACAALIAVGFLYIHFPMRHSANKGFASENEGNAFDHTIERLCKTDAGNGSHGIYRVIDASYSPSHDPKRTP